MRELVVLTGISLAKEASPDLVTEAEEEIPQLEEELSAIPEVERKAIEAEIDVDPVQLVIDR